MSNDKAACRICDLAREARVAGSSPVASLAAKNWRQPYSSHPCNKAHHGAAVQYSGTFVRIRLPYRFDVLAEPKHQKDISPLIDETSQLIRILTTIIKNAQSNPRRGEP
jgi:hypothetical protein